MKIFLSYASEDRDLAEQVYLALTGNGHDVFFDRSSLPAGGDYNQRIALSIKESDYFIFLISPDSVTPSSYALSELQFSRKKWRHPKGSVLPVLVRPTDFQDIPNYLKAVTILEPVGNIPTEIVSQLPKKTSLTFKFLPKAVVFSTIFIVSMLLLYHLFFSKVNEVSVETMADAEHSHVGVDISREEGIATAVSQAASANPDQQIMAESNIEMPNKTNQNFSESNLQGANAIPKVEFKAGARVLAMWNDSDCFYQGEIIQSRDDQHLVHFDSSRQAWINNGLMYVYEKEQAVHPDTNSNVLVSVDSGRKWISGKVGKIREDKYLVMLNLDSKCSFNKRSLWVKPTELVPMH